MSMNIPIQPSMRNLDRFSCLGKFSNPQLGSYIETERHVQTNPDKMTYVETSVSMAVSYLENSKENDLHVQMVSE
jgi:hypothetical protein